MSRGSAGGRLNVGREAASPCYPPTVAGTGGFSSILAPFSFNIMEAGVVGNIRGGRRFPRSVRTALHTCERTSWADFAPLWLAELEGGDGGWTPPLDCPVN